MWASHLPPFSLACAAASCSHTKGRDIRVARVHLLALFLDGPHGLFFVPLLTQFFTRECFYWRLLLMVNTHITLSITNVSCKRTYLTTCVPYVTSRFTHSHDNGPWKRMPFLPGCLDIVCFIFWSGCVGLTSLPVAGVSFDVWVCKSRVKILHVFFSRARALHPHWPCDSLVHLPLDGSTSPWLSEHLRVPVENN